MHPSNSSVTMVIYSLALRMGCLASLELDDCDGQLVADRDEAIRTSSRPRLVHDTMPALLAPYWLPRLHDVLGRTVL